MRYGAGRDASAAAGDPIPLWPLASGPPDLPRLPDHARDVLDAVQAGVMTREEARRYLGLSPGPYSPMPRPVAQAFPQLTRASRDLPEFLPGWARYAGRAAFGFCWRTSMVGAAILVAQSHYTPPMLLVLVVFLLGTAAGLWRLHTRLGEVWRWAAVSAGVAWLGPFWADQYAHLVAAVLLIALLAAALATRTEVLRHRI
jgi:hypothetical protein